MIKRMLIMAAFLTASFAFTTNKLTAKSAPKAEVKIENASEVTLTAEEKISKLYQDFSALNTTMPSEDAFLKGMTGYNKLHAENKIQNELLTIVDFNLPSTQKRMWILDMTTKKVLFNTYVAHGQGTGGNMATKFSNTSNSHQSSLGFYVTAETYHGKNGLSLFIDGMEKGFNSNARNRYVVIHGADYATEGFIKNRGRLGRSYGCPAVPTKLSKEIINTIKGNSVLFIYKENADYLNKSQYLNQPAV
ncbi:MAG: murein L,D-transpeptidase catalytic domain family protein [Salinimicrobium sp.]